MNIKPIKTESDYQKALEEVESLMNAQIDTQEGDKLEILVALIESYEEKYYQILQILCLRLILTLVNFSFISKL
jgi:HTH-type transcriptional regulator/antitoxin HigA